MKDARLHGAYAITDPVLCGEHLIDKVLAAIQGGIRILQYRNKQASRTTQLEETTKLLSLCQQHGVTEIWTADRDFGRFKGVNVRNPLLG